MKIKLSLFFSLLLSVSVHGAIVDLDFSGTGRVALFNEYFYQTAGSTEFQNNGDGMINNASGRYIFGTPRGDAGGAYHSENTHYLTESQRIDFTPRNLTALSGTIGLHSRVNPVTQQGIFARAKIDSATSFTLTLPYGSDLTSTSNTSGTQFFNQQYTLEGDLAIVAGDYLSFYLHQRGDEGEAPSFMVELWFRNGDLLARSDWIDLPSEVAMDYAQAGAMGFFNGAGDNPLRFNHYSAIPEPSWFALFLPVLFLVFRKRVFSRNSR